MTETGTSSTAADEDAPARTCYVDESLRQTGQGLYVLAGVAVRDDCVSTARRVVRACAKKLEHRFHWRWENEASRIRMLESLAELELAVIAIACAPVARGRAPRARSLCLKELLWALDQGKIRRLVIETREPHNDQFDRRVVVGVQQSYRLGVGIAYAFERPLNEPLLWAADAIAGAVSGVATGESSRYGELIRCLIEYSARVRL